MSELQKTTTIPDGNADGILNGDDLSLKIIVLGNNDDLVRIADLLAQNPPTFQRNVIWYKEPVTSEIETLFPDLNEDITTLKGFAVSTINKVAYKINSDTTIDFITVDEAYTTAGLAEYNH